MRISGLLRRLATCLLTLSLALGAQTRLPTQAEFEKQVGEDPLGVLQQLDQALEKGQLTSTEARRALYLRAYTQDALARGDEALETLERYFLLSDDAPVEERARALLLKGEIVGLRLYDRKNAIIYLEQALRVAETMGAEGRVLRRTIMETLGKAKMHVRDLTQAIALLEQAADLIEAADGSEAKAWNLVYQAQAQSALNRFDLAEQLYLKALSITNRGDSPHLDAFIYGRLCIIYKRRRNYEQALSYADRALDIYTRQQDTFNLVRTFNVIGTIYSDLGDHENALVQYLNALDLDQSHSQDPWLDGILLNNVGEAYLHLGNLDKADQYLREATKRFDKGEDSTYASNALLQLAIIASRRGNLEEAINVAERAAELAASGEGVDLRISTHAKLAEFYAAKGDFKQAWMHQSKSQQALEQQQLQPPAAEQNATSTLEREQLVRQLDEQTRTLTELRARHERDWLGLQILALCALTSVWLLYHRWRREWKLRRALVNARRNARQHPNTGLPHLKTALQLVEQKLGRLNRRYEQWYAEDRSLLPDETLRCALITLPALEQWNHRDGLVSGTNRDRDFATRLQAAATPNGWKLFSLREGLLLALAERSRNTSQRISDDARELVNLVSVADPSLLCAVTLAEFPFTPRVARAVDGERLLQVLQAGSIGARQLMTRAAGSAWLILHPLETLPATLLATDTSGGTLLAIRNGMIRVECSHDRHRIRWPSTCETIPPIMGEEVPPRYTECSLG